MTHHEGSSWLDDLMNARLLLPPLTHPFIFMSLHILNAVSEWPRWWSFVLQKTRTSTGCEELDYAHGVLANWPCFALHLHSSILFCSLQQQAIIKAIKTNPPEDCRPCNDRGTDQMGLSDLVIIIVKLTVSLYNLTILHFTLYLRVLCVLLCC